MLIRKIIFVLICCFLTKVSASQYCSSIGQTPEHPYPVCGNSTYHQDPVPDCSTHALDVSCPPTAIYRDFSPFWYKIACYQAGTLGFVITPDYPDADYDWEFFDITGQSPGNVFYNQSLAVCNNFSGTLGPTGTSATGSARRFNCASIPGDNKPTFNAMPALQTGHIYLLIVITGGQGGYTISFGGGTADIKDPTEPHLASAKALCGGKTTIIKLSKKAACNSLASDGSDFTITPPLATVLAASSFSCYTNFDMDSIALTLSNALPPGNYSVNIKNGTDGNSILDFCGNSIPDGESISLVVDPLFPIAMDSLTKPGCLPDELQLVFSKNINCNSIAADGSDFIITGTGAVTVSSAAGVCDYLDKSPVIKLKLSAPILTKGTYQIKLVKGSDGNTIVDECGQAIPAGSVLNFITKDTVNAGFSYAVHLGCKNDTIDFFHNGANDVNTWQWVFDDGRSSTLQNPQMLYDTFTTKHAQLTVSNGFCSDTSEVQTILLGNTLKAAFEATTIICPGDVARFKNKSEGNIISWNWSFGNSNSSSLQNPLPQVYPVPAAITAVTARLAVQNNIGCISTAMQNINLYNECLVLVPNAFTPNGDGLNDYLYPLNGDKATGLLFKIFNRYGQLVFETDNAFKRWDGRFKGQPADPGVYIWILQYTDSYTHKYYEKKGTTILLK